MANPFSERKILKHLPTLNRYFSNEEYPPILVEIDLTNQCTSDCPWCFGFEDRKLKNYTLGVRDSTIDPVVKYNQSMQCVSQLIDDLSMMGVKAITWTGGGDPTCHKGLFDILELAHSKGIENGLITNGVIDVKKALAHCQWIRFSVDGATKDTYGFMHGMPHHFERVVENIKAIARIKKNTGSSCTLGVAFLTGERSKAEIVDFAKLWHGINGIDYIQYRPLLDKYGEKWFADNSDTVDLIKQAKEVDPRVTFSEPKYNALVKGSKGLTKLCHGTFFEIAIAADGNVYPCCHFKGITDGQGNLKYPIGSLYKERFFQIWKRHLQKRNFKTTSDCPSFCRHFGLNSFIEEEIIPQRDHENFI